MGSNELENLVSCFSSLDAYEPKPGAKSVSPGTLALVPQPVD